MELPPRARRILSYDSPRCLYIGTTSACAENTCRVVLSSWLMRNYLRVRGEYGGRHASENHAKELPPRARRIRLHHPRHHLHAGTTSACAENTTVGTISNIRRGNYLRVRGEYLLSSVGPLLSSELPPRARRIRDGGQPTRYFRGTTSACAENTF